MPDVSRWRRGTRRRHSPGLTVGLGCRGHPLRAKARQPTRTRIACRRPTKVTSWMHDRPAREAAELCLVPPQRSRLRYRCGLLMVGPRPKGTTNEACDYSFDQRPGATP